MGVDIDKKFDEAIETLHKMLESRKIEQKEIDKTIIILDALITKKRTEQALEITCLLRELFEKIMKKQETKFWVRRTSCCCWNENDNIQDIKEYKRVCECESPCCEIVVINGLKGLINFAKQNGEIIIYPKKEIYGVGHANTKTERTFKKAISEVIEIYDDFRE